ncbi:MAG: hypothetical protein ACLTMP_05470, partial [Eggerthella lenta]
GTDFSVKFALCFSTLALWCFCTIVPGVLREAADVLHAPVYVMASVGVGGLCGGAAVGYCLAGVIEAVGPTTNYFIKITAILAMVLGLLGTNIVVTKGGLVRIFRKAAVATGSTTESDSFLEEKAALVHGATGLPAGSPTCCASGEATDWGECRKSYSSPRAWLSPIGATSTRSSTSRKSELIDPPAPTRHARRLIAALLHRGRK